MSHYKSNLRDVEFALFEVFGRDRVLGTGPWADMDEESARDTLREIERLATDVVAESFSDADRHPAVFDPTTHHVTVPDSIKQAVTAMYNAEFWRLGLPEEIGGVAAPPSLMWATSEFLLGASPAAFMYMAGTTFAMILHKIGTPEQKATWPHWMVDRRWGATMVLTEPDAGSDVGAGRTKAVQQPDGTWHIEGVKRFITGGEWDLPENIVHLVLARPEGGKPGTKGLSLFIVPKLLVDSDGNPTHRNGVFATNVEKKMGLKSSATCELTFGQHGMPAIGYLVGGVHQGIQQMFQVIEYARMMVGYKSIATLSSGYRNALEYAKTRVQGSDLTHQHDPAAPRVTITHHPDVRRILLLQKAYSEGMRALVVYTSTFQDDVALAAAAGQEDPEAHRMNDLLLPLVKGVGSERSWEMLSLSLQTLGGSGYLQDYPFEQYLRDAKIDTLYEGTTAIQGLDLFFRKIVRDKGQALTRLMTGIQEFAKGDGGDDRLGAERELLGKALEDVQAILGTMVGALTGAQENRSMVNKVGLNTTRLLMALGDLVIGWLLLREAEVALTALGGEPAAKDKAFYQGKVASAKFFAQVRLPLLAGERAVAEATSLEIMDLDEAAF